MEAKLMQPDHTKRGVQISAPASNEGDASSMAPKRGSVVVNGVLFKDP
jgi:hypothetical protein